MGRPGGTFFGLLVGEHTASRRSKGGTIVVERPVNLRPSRELGVDAGASEKVQCDLGLWYESIPKMDGKLFVDTAQTGNGMVFERTNPTFSRIASMDARRDQLKIDVLLVHEGFD
jgi:hypothetical protein